MSKKILTFNHSSIIDKPKKKQKLNSQDEDNGFNTMTKELRNRLIASNKVSSQHKQNETTPNDINNFDNAIQFLERIREKRKKKDKKKHNNTVKCHIKEFPNNESSNIGLKDSQCGILKNGKKPLWRDFHKTRKKKINITDELENNCSDETIINQNEPKPTPIAVAETRPTQIAVAETRPTQIAVEETSPTQIAVEETSPTQIAVAEETMPSQKNKIKLGKSKTKLRFLIKTRKNRLKSNKYTQKNLLKKHGFISSTTNAPDDIIQVMYDSIVDDNTDDSRVCNTNKEDKE